MSEIAFPMQDLTRRKWQSVSAILSLALPVASTLFLLSLADDVGAGLLTGHGGRFTAGLSAIFSTFIVFTSVLTFTVGASAVSFMVFAMMSQRRRDIGLMKAAGCPSGVVFSYFFTELLIVAFSGCAIGSVLGVASDFARVTLSSIANPQTAQGSVNPWLIVPVFVGYLMMAVIVGAKPVFDAAKARPASAMLPVQWLRPEKTPGFWVLSKLRLTTKLTFRGLWRHRAVTVRAAACLSVVFVLTTMTIEGGIVAGQTTRSWTEDAVGMGTVVVAHKDMCSRYEQLLSSFYGGGDGYAVDYLNDSYVISGKLVAQLGRLVGDDNVDGRLVLEATVTEVPGHIFGQASQEIQTVGDSRKGEMLVVGIEPANASAKWFTNGRLLQEDDSTAAVVGDTMGLRMFSMPLVQGIRVLNQTFSVVGVCVDPVNSGNVTYVPLKTLQAAAGTSGLNMVMLDLSQQDNPQQTLELVKSLVNTSNPEFDVVELADVLDEILSALNREWTALTGMTVFSLVSASVCTLMFVALISGDQKQEFGILRAIGARPRSVLQIIVGQSAVTILSSFAVGVALGTIITLLILIPQPTATVYTVLEASAWLLAAVVAVFAISLYPTRRFSGRPLTEAMRQP